VRAAPGILPLAAILLAALALHYDALKAPFFADDYLFLDQVRDRSLIAALAAPDPLGNYFRPVSRQLHFWTLARLTHESPAAFHAVNLGIFVVVVGLSFAVCRAAAGIEAAAIGASFVALHHSADVPVLWASGSQDLLAVAGSLAAFLLHRGGRRFWAAAVLLIALLCKETVLMAPWIAAALDRRPRERWSSVLRRAWPMGAAVGLWGLIWLATRARRPAIGLEARFDPAGLPGMLVHLPQVVLGLEWPHDGPAKMLHAPPWLALGLVALGLWGARSGARRPLPHQPKRSTTTPAPAAAPLSPARGALFAGLAWAVLGMLPAFAVADIWSAYFYLFAMCGVGLALGVLLRARPLIVTLAVMGILGWGSENARRMTEFATGRGAWTVQSHVNRFYLERAMRKAGYYLAELKRLRPNLPRNATLFFAGIPAQVAFQSADGPLMRWAYQDSSLHSYFLSRFDLSKARRGPVYFFAAWNDTLHELTGLDWLNRLALSLILGDTPEPARDMLTLMVERRPGVPALHYWRAWTQWALADTQGARASLEHAGVAPVGGAAAEIARALELVAARDTTAAAALMRTAVLRYGLDAGVHGLVADLSLSRRRLGTPPTGEEVIETYAARVLAPEQPGSWRRWGVVQALGGRNEPAAASLERYLALAGPAGQGDPDIAWLMAQLKRRLPGGELAQEQLRR
jgi:hypothetical protein